ncbi:hypothetical protein LQW54_008910, partial [Pestalotiopsis sp. IQ-011]
PHPHHRASLFRYLFPRLSQRYRERLLGFHLDTLPYYKHRFQSRVYRFILERQRRRTEQSRLVDRARRLLLGPPKPKSTPTPRAPKKRDVIRAKRRSVMSYLSGYGSGGGADVGGKRKKLAAMAGRVYSAGASAMTEIRESYNQTRAGQADTEEIQKITIPGAFPDVKIVVQGDEQMVLFPSYAKRHIKGQSRQYEDPAGPPATSTVDIDEEEYWRQEWARHEDEKAIVDVDVRGWIYNPHRGPMTRRNRILIGLARQLSGIPTPQAQQQQLDPSPASIHQLHEEEREQRRIAQEAQEIERRGQAERAAALNGGYSEAPKDADSEDEYRSPSSSNSRSRSPTPSVRSAPRSPNMGASRSNTAGGSQLSEAELAVANANLMARIAPFMTTPLMQRPITVFFYNDSQSQSKTVTTNDSGHFILRAPLDFVPTHIRVLANEDLSATEPVQIIEPEGISLISDIDDTIKHSSITTGAKEIFRNTFIRDLGDLTVDGVREWYTSLHDLGVRIHYCSNSPWQLYPVIATYFKMAGLPPGSIHLKQYSGMLQGIFEPVAERKKGTLEKIMHDFPQRRFLLVGDSGEADLEVYTEIAVANPGRIVAIFIRDVTTPERSGYFDSGFGRSNKPELSRPSTSTDSSRNNSVNDRASRPQLPPRTSTTKSAREDGPLMGDLIDFSEEPQESPPQESRYLQEMRENLPPGKKAPPPRPAKPNALKSSSPVASLNGASSHAETPEQKKPPPPPARRTTPSNNNPAKPGAPHPLSQMQNSSQQGLNASQQNLSGAASYDRRGSGSSKSGAPPPPPPRRTNTSSSLQQASFQGTMSSHRGTPDSDVDAMDSLPPSSYQSSTKNTGSAPEAPLNKKLDLWHRRLQRAQDTLDQHGVALYTWRRGGDVIKEADGLVRQTMKDMGLKVGEGEKRNLKNK